MRRVFVASVAVIALTVGVVSPAGGQEFGFLTLDPTEGPVGEVVDAAVDTAVIEENCIVSPEEFVEILNALFLGDGTDPAPFTEAITEYLDATWGGTVPSDPEDPQVFAYTAYVGALLGLVLGLAEPEGAWEQTFVLTFASLEQELVGEMGNYDPATGEGQVAVPDVDPGTWAVAAVCLGWNPAPTANGTIAPAIDAGVQWTLDNIEPPYPTNLFDPVFQELAALVAPVMLGADPTGSGTLNVQGGPWVELFCVWDDSGACPAEEVPIVPVDPGDDPGDPADPVATAPRFTG